MSHLPVIADPSHGTGKAKLVLPISLGMVAAGADGLILEVHPSPEHALCDGAQSLTFDQFGVVMQKTAAIAAAIGKRIESQTPIPA
jgi:3-deoxy-7-phosphoheptulonate synthase